ncbi:hypothetical protein PR202_ga21188 [Eleusine coracana subsp. coracana]|uniref:F-box domain-containing protein n=1 Tax=Eleusine coracana subsp. coracana TaxID=191504 RepID=A0AAV5D0R4_ELECO|nr:hypothetical protein PR202_ga21188 [Eleusine coracana subsp. coracana]
MEASPPCRRPQPPSPASSLGPLPPEILQTIISHLPIRDAVRTSAVSRAWRRLWETTPDLALEWGCGTDLAVADAVLARYSGPVRSFNFFLHQEARPFELFPSYEEAFERADDWITILAGKGVRSLTLGFSEDSDDLPHTLQTTLFSCRELTRLRLCNCDFPLVPEESVRFPNLTWCSLDSVGFKYAGEKDVVALISGSPLLEVLWLKDPYFPYDENSFKKGCVIEAPNLRHLKIVSEDDFGWKMGDLPSIETVEINIKDYDINRDFVQLMTALAEVKKLILKMPVSCFLFLVAGFIYHHVIQETNSSHTVF